MTALARKPVEAPTGPAPTIFEAIVRQRCVTATYNRMQVLLAPHVIFTRHGELYVGAVTIERDGQPPREEKLGLFKLDGLADLGPSERPFRISAVFDRHDARYAETALMTVEA